MFKSRPWDPSKKLDLAICYKFHQSRALYDLIWPTWWQKKVPFFKNLEKINEQLNSSLYFFKSRPWDPSKKLDLAICYKFHQSRALYDLIWPARWKKNDANLHQTKTLFTTCRYLLPPLHSKSSPQEKWETPIYLVFLHWIQLSHLSVGDFPWYSLGTRTKGQPPYFTVFFVRRAT